MLIHACVCNRTLDNYLKEHTAALKYRKGIVNAFGNTSRLGTSQGARGTVNVYTRYAPPRPVSHRAGQSRPPALPPSYGFLCFGATSVMCLEHHWCLFSCPPDIPRTHDLTPKDTVWETYSAKVKPDALFCPCSRERSRRCQSNQGVWSLI